MPTPAPAAAPGAAPDYARDLEVAYAAPYVCLLLRPASRLVVTEWLDYANTEQYQDTLERALALGRDLRAERWIGHNERMRVIAPAAQRWTTDVWWAEFARLPLRRLAVVVGRDQFNKLAIDRILTRASAASPFDTRHFEAFADALAWVHGAGDAGAAPAAAGPAAA